MFDCMELGSKVASDAVRTASMTKVRDMSKLVSVYPHPHSKWKLYLGTFSPGRPLLRNSRDLNGYPGTTPLSSADSCCQVALKSIRLCTPGWNRFTIQNHLDQSCQQWVLILSRRYSPSHMPLTYRDMKPKYQVDRGCSPRAKSSDDRLEQGPLWSWLWGISTG